MGARHNFPKGETAQRFLPGFAGNTAATPTIRGLVHKLKFFRKNKPATLQKPPHPPAANSAPLAGRPSPHRRQQAQHGGVIFINLRDLYGVTQVVARPESPVFKTAEEVKSEYVLNITGKVTPRPGSNANKDMPTGEIEIEASGIAILNPSQPLPFELSEHADVSEETRLKYRFLDLRRPRMAKNLALRSRLSQVVRNNLYGLDFNEIETPLLGPLKARAPGALRNNPASLRPAPVPQQFKRY